LWNRIRSFVAVFLGPFRGLQVYKQYPLYCLNWLEDLFCYLGITVIFEHNLFCWSRINSLCFPLFTLFDFCLLPCLLETVNSSLPLYSLVCLLRNMFTGTPTAWAQTAWKLVSLSRRLGSYVCVHEMLLQFWQWNRINLMNQIVGFWDPLDLTIQSRQDIHTN